MRSFSAAQVVLAVVTVSFTLAGFVAGRLFFPATAAATESSSATGGAGEPPPTSTNLASPPGSSETISEIVTNAITVGSRNGSGTELHLELYRAVSQMSAEELPMAVGAAMQNNQSTAAAAIAGYWAERDLDAAVKWMRALPDERRSAYAPGIATVWGAMDPQGLFAWLETLPDEERLKVGLQVSGALISRAGKIGHEKLWTRLFSQTMGQDSVRTAVFLESWAGAAPQRAAQVALELPSGGARSAAVEAVARKWGWHDPKTAEAWVESIDDGILAGKARVALAVGIASVDGARAAAMIGEQNATLENIRALQSVVHVWSEREPQAAAAWVAALPQEAPKSELLDAVVSAVSRRNPELALDLLKEHAAAASPWSFSGVHSVFFSLFQSRGAGASLRAAEALPDSLRRGAYGGLFNSWANFSPAALNDWIQRQPAGEMRSVAIERAAQSLPAGSKEQLEWVRKMPPDPGRDTVLENLTYNSLPELPLSADDYMALSTDRDRAKEHLLRIARRAAAGKKWVAPRWVQETAVFSAEEKARILTPPERASSGGNAP